MTRITVALALSLAMAAGVSRAQAAAPVEVVRLSDGGYSVTVSVPTDRKAVLDAVCAAAEASCIFPEAIPATSVGPLHARGSWSQVADALLKDSGLGFATGGLAGGPNAQPVLVVSVDKAAAASAADPSARIPIFDIADRFSGAEPDELPIVAEVPEGSPSPADAQASATPAAPMVLASGGPAAEQGPVVATPFAMPDGRPIYAVTSVRPPGLVTEPVVTPFASSDGTPLVAQPATGPSEYTPFSSPDGEPIPMPPQDPNAKADHPTQPGYRQN